MSSVSYWKLATGILGAAALLGWVLATANMTMGTANIADDFSVPPKQEPLTAQESREGLEKLYERRLWSTAIPETHSTENPDNNASTDAPPPPEGLDRFTLVGIFRVSGVPEALLIDKKAMAMDEAATFSAREGERLRGTEVTLDQIDDTKVRISIPNSGRWLFLFTPPEELAIDQGRHTRYTNHNNALSD